MKVEKWKGGLIFLFYSCSYGIFLWLLLNIVLNAQDIDPTTYGGTFAVKNYYNPLLLMIFIMIITVILFFLYFLLQRYNYGEKIFFIMIILIGMLQIWCAYYLAFDISESGKFTDLGVIIDAASSIIAGETYTSDYFYNYPFQAGIVSEIVLWYRFMSLFGIKSLNVSCIILNILSIDAAIISLYFLTKEILGSAAANFSLVLSFMFTPYFAYITYYYTDTLSMPYSILALLLYVILEKYEKRKDINYGGVLRRGYLLLGFVLALGIYIKATVAIMLVAIFIHLLFSELSLNNFVKAGLIIVVILLFQLVSFHKIDSMNWFSYNLTEAKGYPKTMWFLMGTNEQRYGAYAPDDVAVMLSEDTYGKRSKKCVEALKERLETNGLEWYIKFLTKKNVWMWGDGKYFASEKLAWFPHKRESKVLDFFSKDSDGSKVFCYWSQSVQIILILFILLSFRKGKQNLFVDDMFIVHLSIFGIFLFMSLWEARPRYLLNMTPLFLLSAIDGIDFTIKNMKIKIGDKSKNML